MDGFLTAEREGPNVKLTMTYPHDTDYAFSVERQDTEMDESGAPQLVWNPIHVSVAKFVTGVVDYDMAPLDPANPNLAPQPLPGPRTYRALAYEQVTTPGVNVLQLVTDGDYTPVVTVA